tara:strand:+ start:1913 stop:2812 length:900 start_codon:yes stop_codon:yes gene_type:complete
MSSRLSNPIDSSDYRYGGSSSEQPRLARSGGRSSKPSRPRPAQPSRQGRLAKATLGPKGSKDKTSYLQAVGSTSSARQLAQETKRVNREIRETGSFRQPTGEVLKGIQGARKPRARGGGGVARPSGPSSSAPQPEPEPEPEPQPSGFILPSGSFGVDRTLGGGGLDRETPLQRRRAKAPTPSVPATDPFASIGGVAQLKERLGTGGGSGGLPRARSQPVGRSSADILSEFAPLGGVGLSQQRSAPTQLLKDRRTALQLDAEPLGRAQQPAEPSSGPLGDNSPRTRRQRLTDGLKRFAGD